MNSDFWKNAGVAAVNLFLYTTSVENFSQYIVHHYDKLPENVKYPGLNLLSWLRSAN